MKSIRKPAFPTLRRGKQNCIATALLTAVALTASSALAQEKGPGTQAVGPYKDFKGTIKLDVRDSKSDWGPFTPKKAPEGAPNILFVLYDDTGLSAWSPYGGRINMPTLDRLAKSGLTYSQWHTVALCSPTRSTLSAGRNHNRWHDPSMAALKMLRRMPKRS